MEEDEPSPPPDAIEIRRESGAIIERLGGRRPNNLPFIEWFEPRSQTDAFQRMLAMCGLQQIGLGRPVEKVKQWATENRLAHAFSQVEKRIIEKSDEQITDREKINLSWYIEAIWAFAWAGSLIPDIPIEVGVGNQLDLLFEEMEKSGTGLESAFRLRPQREIYCKLDLYYLAHWYARDGRLNGYHTGAFDLEIIMERRKALEWLSDRSLTDWDEIPLDT